MRLGPVMCDSTAMPTQQRVRSDQPARPSRSRQGLGDGAEQAPITIGDYGLGIAPTEHGKLVALDDDLEILRATATDSQTRH